MSYLRRSVDASTVGGQPSTVEVAVSLGELELEGVDVATVELVGGGEYIMVCLNASHLAQLAEVVAVLATAAAADADTGVFGIDGYDGYDDRLCLLRLYVHDEPGLAVIEAHSDQLHSAVLTVDALAELHTACVDAHTTLTAATAA